jgi:hypothetical protein
MLRTLRLAALATMVSLAFGSLARGYDDYHRRGEAREQGYQNGYRDGARAGHSDRERGRRFNLKNDQWEDAHGYEHWMGDHGQYKRAYRDGYAEGYRRGFDSDDRRDWDRDRDNHR